MNLLLDVAMFCFAGAFGLAFGSWCARRIWPPPVEMPRADSPEPVESMKGGIR
jgi:hypothetical protein